MYKRQQHTTFTLGNEDLAENYHGLLASIDEPFADQSALPSYVCLLYTSDAADERSSVDLGGRRIIKKKKTEE